MAKHMTSLSWQVLKSHCHPEIGKLEHHHCICSLADFFGQEQLKQKQKAEEKAHVTWSGIEFIHFVLLNMCQNNCSCSVIQ